MQVKGFIENCPAPIQTKYKWPNGEPKFMYSMYVDGTRYSTKGKDFSKLEGKYVEFEATQNGEYWNADPATVKEVAAPDNTKQSRSSGQLPAGPDRQDSIIYQSSRKDAIEMVNALLAKDMIDFGKAKGAQKIEMYEVYVDHYTTRLFDDAKRLAPPAHKSPVVATAPEEAQALAKPARKAPVMPEHDDFEDADIP